MSTPEKSNMPISKTPCFWLSGLLAIGILAGCQTPVDVTRVDPETVHHQLTRNVLSTGETSPYTDIVLHVSDLQACYFDDPRGTLSTLHDILLTPDGPAPVAFALGELSFLYADSSDKTLLAPAVDRRGGTKNLSGLTNSWNDVEESFRYWAERYAGGLVSFVGEKIV